MFKKIISAILFLVIFSPIANATYVRFAVNMKGSGMISSNDAYMTSTFQDEIGMGGDLTHGYLHLIQSTADTNIYYATFNIPANQLFEYQFEMGITGYDLENIPIESQSLANGYRWLYVDSMINDTLKMPAVFYSGNNTAADTMYRFKVNMSNEIVTANDVRIGGSFQSTLAKMYSFGNGIYISNQSSAALTSHKISTRIVDARWLSPLPKAALTAAVQGCKHILIVDETRHSGGVAEALMAHFHETTSAKLARVTAEDSFIATGPAYAVTMPSAESITKAALELCR